MAMTKRADSPLTGVKHCSRSHLDLAPVSDASKFRSAVPSFATENISN